MSNRKPRHLQHPVTAALSHYRAVDLGSKVLGLGSVAVWRALKALSQLLVVSYAFWGALDGSLNPTLAFLGMLLAYLGAEGAESIIAAVGKTSFDISYTQDNSDDDDPRTDGGTILATRTEDDGNESRRED